MRLGVPNRIERLLTPRRVCCIVQHVHKDVSSPPLCRRGVPGHRCTCAGLHPHIGLFSTWKVTPPSLSLSTSVELARTAPGVCTPPLLRAPIQQFDTFENKNDSTRDRWHRVGSARKRREENDRSIGKGGERLCVSQG